MSTHCVALAIPRHICLDPPIFVVPDRPWDGFSKMIASSVQTTYSARWPSATSSVISRGEPAAIGAELALQFVKRKALSVIRGSVEPSVGEIGHPGTARTDKFPRTSAIVIARDVPVRIISAEQQRHTIQSVA